MVCKKKISTIVPITIFFDEILIFEIDYSITKRQLEICTVEIPYNEKLEHRRPLCNERERDPLHILLVATSYYAHHIMRAVSLSVRLCE